MSLTIAEHLAHARFHAREHPAGVGASVVRATFEDGERVWDCVVSDDREWHYMRVIGTDLGPFENLPSEEVEEGVMRFAQELPATYRIRHLLNGNPLHIDSTGAVTD